MVKKSKAETIMVVDDSPDTLEVLHRSIEHMGFVVFPCESAGEAIELLKDNPVDLVITDYHMPFIGGLDLIKHIREQYPNTEVMMITGYASVEGAVEAIKAGAEEYLAKPFTDEELEQAIERSLEKLSIRSAKKGSPADDYSVKFGLILVSEAMKKVSKLIKKAASSEHPVLISGEPGSEKELAARIIHYSSSRSKYPFIYVNCTEIPESFLENEIFGYLRPGQGEEFDGSPEETRPAKSIQPGFLEMVGNGTVFFDEISKTPLAVQVKLLDILANYELTCVGDNTARPVGCRIIASTSKDLITLVGKGLFREDLFFQLNMVNIIIPPLRDRKDDIIPLCREHLARESRELGRSAPLSFSEDVTRAALLYEWPGNSKELASLIGTLTAQVETDQVKLSDLPRCIRAALDLEKKSKKSLNEIEVEHIRDVLQSCAGNKTKAAQLLGIDRKTLRDKLDRLNR